MGHSAVFHLPVSVFVQVLSVCMLVGLLVYLCLTVIGCLRGGGGIFVSCGPVGRLVIHGLLGIYGCTGLRCGI